MEFANKEERAALKKQRQIRRAMRKGMSPVEIKSKYGSMTTEEAHAANTGRAKNQSDPVKKFLAANAIIAGTVLTAGALGGALAGGAGAAAGTAAAGGAAAGGAAAGGAAAAGTAAAAGGTAAAAGTAAAGTGVSALGATATSTGVVEAGKILRGLKKASEVTKTIDPIINTAQAGVDLYNSIQGQTYGVNPEDEKVTTPSGPEYDFFTPYSFDE